MKVCFVGTGSMGSRHMKNLSELFTEQKIPFSFDVLRNTDHPLPETLSKLINHAYQNTETMPQDYDIIFITNPTSLHYTTIRDLANHTKHFFIEKPVFDHINYDISQLGIKDGSIVYVAAPLRYTAVIRKLSQIIAQEPVFAARCICSSYLPDWRPNTDYQKSYSAHREMGGGVRIDLIHEWDYLSYLFGIPEEICSFSGKYSNLKITSDDLAVYIARYPQMLLSLHLDYLGRGPCRELEIYTSDDVITGDLIKSELRYRRTGMIESLPQDRDAYQKEELRCFLEMVAGKCHNTNDITHAVNVMKLALGS